MALEIKDPLEIEMLPMAYSQREAANQSHETWKLKLNVDGCSKVDPGQAGYEGLLRDETGKGTEGVDIESDSELAINQIQIEPCLNSPYKALIEDAKFLLKRCNCSLCHTPREGNKCADLLANMRVAQDEHVLVLEEPPNEVKALIINDMIGVSVLRD
ncbi:uncharacterized protein LOC114299952 [Camellia sinensis]|uniref:uncharacterized protein LOC114299952 n=1 Tax=Camellia sinensis TaxID=4442 RepID=UPI00103556A0|nr:uncharacterized protein LOC114299952 [Camellia sinensis]